MWAATPPRRRPPEAASSEARNSVGRGQSVDFQNVLVFESVPLNRMLAESGSGTLAGNAHSDTFLQIARSDAALLSGLFQEQFDRKYTVLKDGGGIRIRTLEGIASRFTVCPIALISMPCFHVCYLFAVDTFRFCLIIMAKSSKEVKR